jgi:hypothetical protein
MADTTDAIAALGAQVQELKRQLAAWEAFFRTLGEDPPAARPSPPHLRAVPVTARPNRVRNIKPALPATPEGATP